MCTSAWTCIASAPRSPSWTTPASPAQPQPGQRPGKLVPILGALPPGTPVAFEAAYGWGWLVDLLEMPYRVRRRPASDPETRATLTNQMSDIKAQIAFHQAWLQVEAPHVAEAFDTLVRVAQEEGGAQIKHAWKEPLRDTDAAMNLGVAYDRSKSDAARIRTLERMREELSFPRWPSRRDALRNRN